jgi:cbb3-type cytochrome c oxidase subunit I
MREVVMRRRAETLERLEELRNRYLEPILKRFPVILPTAEDSAARWGLYSSLVWFIVALLMGLLLAVKTVFPQFLDQWPWMSYGRLRQAETNLLVWGVFYAGLVGAAFAIVPRICGIKLWSERIGTQTIILLDNVVLIGTVMLLLGRTQGIEGGEWIWPIDLALLNVMFMVLQNLLTTVMRRKERRLYISAWHFLAASIVLPVTYGFANLASPWYYGVNQAIVANFGAAGAWAGLLLMGIGAAYFFLPRGAGHPVYSSRMAWLGFWSLVLAAPWLGTATLTLGPAQDWVETLSIVFAILMLVPVSLALVNLWGTARGAWGAGDPAVSFAIGGGVFWLLATAQLAVGALRHPSSVVGLTWWQDATTTALSGAVGLWLAGTLYHMLPRMRGRRLFSLRLASAHFWLSSLGIAAGWLALSVAGLIQGYLQIAGADSSTGIAHGRGWAEIIVAVRPMLAARIAGGTLIAAGALLFVFNLFKTVASGAEAAPEPVAVPVGGAA